MSQINVTTIRNRTGGPPALDKGVVVTGCTTSTSGYFSGNVTIGGTLTHEDVTNIDSVGVVTARGGFLAGNPAVSIGATITAAGDASFSGIGTFNSNLRGNYAGIGMTYMTGVRTLGVASTDIFISQQPYPSWSVGIATANWYPPDNPGDSPALTTAQRDADKYYVWNESNYNSNPSTAWVLTDP